MEIHLLTFQHVEMDKNLICSYIPSKGITGILKGVEPGSSPPYVTGMSTPRE